MLILGSHLSLLGLDSLEVGLGIYSLETTPYDP